MTTTAKNVEARISIPGDVDEAADKVAAATNLSKPRVLGTFARYGLPAGAQALLGPLNLTLPEVLATPGDAALPPTRTAKTLLERTGRKLRRAE